MFHLLYNDPYLLEVLGVNPTHKMAVVVFVCVCVCNQLLRFIAINPAFPFCNIYARYTL